MSVHDWIKQLCRDEDLGAPAIDALGDWEFAWDDMPCVVSITPGEEAVVFIAGVAPIPEAPSELYATLLERNLAPSDLGGASFALDRGAGRVCLVWRNPVRNMDARSFRESLSSFLDSASRCAQEIASGNHAGVAPTNHVAEDNFADLALTGAIRV